MKGFAGVFCGTRGDCAGKFADEAFCLGGKLVALGYKFFYGGGTSGLSKALLKGTLSAGGFDKIVAIVQKHELKAVKEIGIGYYEVNSVAERKDFILSKAQKIFVLPGGFGTLDEVAYALLCKQSGQYFGDIVFLDSFGYWGFLDQMFKEMAGHGCIEQADKLLYTMVDSVEDIK